MKKKWFQLEKPSALENIEETHQVNAEEVEDLLRVGILEDLFEAMLGDQHEGLGGLL